MDNRGMVHAFAPPTANDSALQPHVAMDVMPAYPASLNSFICAESAEYSLLTDSRDLGNCGDNLIDLFLLRFCFHISFSIS